MNSTANDIFSELEKAVASGERVALATVAATRGSTPQTVGARLLIFESGRMFGTVGGGCVEAEVYAEAREVLRTKKSGLYSFALTADTAQDEGMVCGGTMDIFIEVWERDAALQSA
ncbi:MAG TPA: XdhC family protein [Blastocatellia bacterium]|nr:XdhC family protein [Blastocatellia bacterium]